MDLSNGGGRYQVDSEGVLNELGAGLVSLVPALEGKVPKSFFFCLPNGAKRRARAKNPAEKEVGCSLQDG